MSNVACKANTRNFVIFVHILLALSLYAEFIQWYLKLQFKKVIDGNMPFAENI